MDEDASRQAAILKPLTIFAKNFDTLMLVKDVLKRDGSRILAAAKPVGEAIDEVKRTATKSASKKRVAALKAVLNESEADFKSWSDVRSFLQDWELVMLFSFAEAYLEDVLVLLAEFQPEWAGELEKLVLPRRGRYDAAGRKRSSRRITLNGGFRC